MVDDIRKVRVSDIITFYETAVWLPRCARVASPLDQEEELPILCKAVLYDTVDEKLR